MTDVGSIELGPTVDSCTRDQSGGGLIDQPTNDLDLPTLRHLEEALLEFPGCCIVVTHGRWFLDRIATHILAFDTDLGVQFHPGNYESWREKRAELREARGMPAEESAGTHKRFSGS